MTQFLLPKKYLVGYGIRKKILKKIKCRIGKKPYFYFVNKNESIDLDTEEDFEYLKYYVKENLYR